MNNSKTTSGVSAPIRFNSTSATLRWSSVGVELADRALSEFVSAMADVKRKAG